MAKRASRKSISGKSGKAGTPPLTGRELHNSKIFQNAAKKMPDKVSALLLPKIKPFELHFVDRNELAKFSDDPIKPDVPDWMDVTAQPKKNLFAGKGAARVQYRGIELDPLWIFGGDDRRTYYDTSYPWGSVCSVNVGGGFGSGVVVGPRHVLTASHVVNWSVPGGATGTVDVLRGAGHMPSFSSPIEYAIAFTHVTTPGYVGWTELDEDYAVVITRDRIPDRIRGLGVRTYDSSWDGDPYWCTFGYSGDITSGRSPVYQNRCTLDEHSSDLGGGRAMNTNADVLRGQSGSPMVGLWPDGPYVVAVVSSVSLSGRRENYCSGGSDLTRMVRYARALSR